MLIKLITEDRAMMYEAIIREQRKGKEMRARKAEKKSKLLCFRKKNRIVIVAKYA